VRVCIGAGYQQGRSQPSSLVLVVRGHGGCQQSHDFRGYRVEPGRLHDGCMVRPANHAARFGSGRLRIYLIGRRIGLVSCSQPPPRFDGRECGVSLSE
jgi:hypothetical protein